MKKLYIKILITLDVIKREFFKAKPEDIMKYFLMENLVETFADIHDFPDDYFTQYVGENTVKIQLKYS
jgi:hypothetical protein